MQTKRMSKAQRISLFVILFSVVGFSLFFHFKGILETAPEPLLNPYISSGNVPTPKPIKQPTKPLTRGLASYYSEKGCVGCHPQLIMANGQRLDDRKITVAYNRTKLGAKIEIRNIETGESVIATVTDTGGFEKLGRLIDLSVATKKAINCGDLCQVEVKEL